MCQCIVECGLLTGTRSAEGIMASGHANRTNRPNTWLHRPASQRDVLTCQLGAVHTWHKADAEKSHLSPALKPRLHCIHLVRLRGVLMRRREAGRGAVSLRASSQRSA